MKTSEVSDADANRILGETLGAHVWGSRAVQDGVLRLDLGTPHLHVREPLSNANAAGDVVKAIHSRRIVVPVGRWHLFVENGLWRISVSDAACDRSDAENEDASRNLTRCLALLDGQKVKAIAKITSDEWRMTFDLGGELTIETAAVEGNASAPVWTLFLEDDTNLSYMSDGTFSLEQDVN